MKITVIYHSADFDGLFCREIAKKFLPDAELIGWNFGDSPVRVPAEGGIYVLDLPVDEVFGFKYGRTSKGDEIAFRNDADPAFFRSSNPFLFMQRVVWIDHHKSSIESHPNSIPGYRIDGVAACRLAWQWFTIVDGNTSYGNVGNSIRAAGVLPMIQDFKARTVNEPLAVRLAGEYDIWDKRDPHAEIFQFGLRSRQLTDADWNLLLGDGESLIDILLDDGGLLQRYQQSTDASVVNHRSFIIEWGGLKFLALTTARCNSLTFAAKDIPETGHDALMGFYYNGKTWTVSMYHANHRTDLDLSHIAVKYGGGGHRGACGFTADQLPFLT